MMNIRYMMGVLLAMAFISVGCGPLAPTPNVTLEIDKKYIKKLSRLQLWVLDPKRKDGKVMNCASLLKKQWDLDFAQFTVEGQKSLIVGVPTQTSELSKLKLGDKLFFAAGYAAQDKDNTPQVFGCGEAKIEAGKKTSVAIAMVVY